jgi:hypothetical protein
MLGDRALGFGSIGASGAPGALGADGLHHAAKAKRVIFLYMDGGPSQMDTFDPKPRLVAEHGQRFGMAMERTQFNDNGSTFAGPWGFQPGGTCGTPVSDLFPHVRACADDLLVVRSMTSQFSEHTNANYFLHTGAGIAGRPSMGAWTSYGLGSGGRDLPAFIVLHGGLIPPGGVECFGNGFLPATHHGSIVLPRGSGLANVEPREADPGAQARKRHLVESLDASFTESTGRHDAVESAIRNWELAYGMQSAVPELMDLSGETAETLALYGVDSEYAPTATYARQCLLARRLVERGVRFVELTCPGTGNDRWDQHNAIVKGHEENARAVDSSAAACSTTRSSSGRASSAAPPSPRAATAATTIPSASRSGSPAAGSRAARCTGRPTTTATRPSMASSTSTTCTPRCSTCSAWTTSGSCTASAAATCGSPTCTAA